MGWDLILSIQRLELPLQALSVIAKTTSDGELLPQNAK